MFSAADIKSTLVTNTGSGTATTSALDTTGYDLLLAVTNFYINGTGSNGLTISDSYGNTWQTRPKVSASRQGLQLSWCKPKPGGTGSGHTLTATTNGGSNQIFGCVTFIAIKGSYSVPFGIENSGLAGSGSTTIRPGPIVANDGDLLIFATAEDDPADSGTPAYAVDSGFQIIQQ